MSRKSTQCHFLGQRGCQPLAPFADRAGLNVYCLFKGTWICDPEIDQLRAEPLPGQANGSEGAFE